MSGGVVRKKSTRRRTTKLKTGTDALRATAIGNATIVILVLFMGGVQLISVGILGEYIARIYEEVKGRPKFIVDEAVGFGQSKVELVSHQHVAA